MGNLLAFIIAFAPLPVVDVLSCPPYTQGYVADNVIHVCPDLTIPREEVVNHEIIHVIHYNLGLSNDETILPEPWFTDLVREYLTPEEVLFVLTSENYREYPNQELEARLLSKLPRPIIMTLLIASEEYGTNSSFSD